MKYDVTATAPGFTRTIRVTADNPTAAKKKAKGQLPITGCKLKAKKVS